MKNTMIKVLSLVIALTMIVATLGTVTVFAADECNHTKGALIETKAPTCQTPGFSRYTCGACGEEWVTDVIQASDEYHNIEEVDAVPASCLTPGYTAGKRCTVKGCDEVFEGVKPTGEAQKAHVFVGAEVLPTCTAVGKVVYTCSSCGKTADWLKAEQNKASNINPDGSLKKVYVLASQLAEGTGEGADFVWKWAEKATDKAALGHDYEWVIEKAPVKNTTKPCEDGLSKGVCANCGDVKTVTIPVHNEDSWTLINPSNLPCIEWNNQAKWCSSCKANTIKPGDENKKQQTTGHNAADTYTGKLDPSNAAFLAYGFKLQDLYDLGFELNDDLYVAATCTTAGSQLVKCSCGELYVKTINALGHDWSEWSDYSIPTLCTEDSVKTRECERDGCNATDKQVYAPASKSAHATKVEVTAPHCLTMGYTTTTCTNTFVINGVTYTCGHNVVSDWKDPAGHTYGPVTLKSGSCDNGEWVKTCTREGCKATDAGHEIAGTPSNAQKTHSWGAEVKVAGTCHEKSYKYKQCTKCKYYYADADTVSETLVKLRTDSDKVDANNHEYVHVRWAAATPTCATASAVEVVECKWCDVDDNTQITRTVTNPVEHSFKTGYVTVAQNGTKTFHADGLAATCKTTGFKADGEACENCCLVKKAPTVLEKDPKNHADAPDDDNKVGSYVAATCKAAGYQKHYLTCCGEVTVENAADPKKTTCSWVAGTAGDALVPATCTTNGSHKYQKCEWCGTIKPDSVDVTGCTACTDAKHEAAKFNNDPVIPKLGHDFSVDVARTKSASGSDNNSTCDDTFIKAHKKCSRCDYVKFNGVEYKSKNEAAFLAVARELPHYNAYLQTFEDKDSTCTATGIYGGTYCVVCQKDQWIDPIDAHDIAGGEQFRINYINIAAEGQPANWKILDCTKDACIVYECADCSYRESAYTKAADANHNWSSWTNDSFIGKHTCKDDKTQSRHCQDCGDGVTTRVETKLQTNGAATGCYTTKGVTGSNAQKFFISYDCDKIAEFIGWTCDVCHDTVDEDDIVHTLVNGGEGYIVNPTCTTDGYKVIYCVGCGLTKADDAIDYVDPIYTTLKPSGALLENAPAIDYNHDEKNGIILETTADHVKYICADCGETITRVIEKTVELKETFAVSSNKVAAGETFTVTYTLSGKADKFSAKQVTVPYNSALLTFVGVEANADIDGLYAVASANSNNVGVSLVVANDANGNKREVTTSAEGTTLFTLTFVANKTASGDVAVAGKTVKISAVGNLNGDAVITADDAQAIFNHIGTDNVAADVNLDGIVNLADVIALAKFAASDKKAADYLEMVGELDKLEDAAKAIEILGDHNGDRVINDADILALIAKVEGLIKGQSVSWLGDYVTMAEVVAAVNAGKLVAPLA